MLSSAIPTSGGAWIWAIGVVLVLPTSIAAVLLRVLTGSFVPDQARYVVLGVYAIQIVVGVFLLGSIARSRLEIDGRNVTIVGSVYKLEVPLREVDPASIRSQEEHSAPVFAVRTNGIALPGFKAGWFKESDGAEVFVAFGGGPSVRFQTTAGVHVVVGTSEPTRVEDVLRQGLGQPPRSVR